MNYGNIKNCDIANGEGVRVTLFVSGCTNHCKGCFQPQTWDFNFGEEFTPAVENKIIGMLEPDYINGLTLLGGEPFEPENQKALLPFIERVRAIYPNKTIWAYSGFTFEQMLTSGTHCNTEYTQKMLENIDILVDGRFEEELKDISLKFRGSSNQRIIDVKRSLEAGKIILWDK